MNRTRQRTCNLESLARLCSNPFPIDVGLRFEEGLVVELITADQPEVKGQVNKA